MEFRDAEHIAALIRQVVEALRETIAGIPSAGRDSEAQHDRTNQETGRGDVPWGPLPAETFQSILAATSVAVADHLHSTSQLLLDDIDFGPTVMARSTAEGAGRIAWLLPPDANVRTRVGRGYALRIRGLRDNAKHIDTLANLKAPPDEGLAAAARQAAARVSEVLGHAHALGFKTIKDSTTKRPIGLDGLSPPPGDDLMYESLRHLDTPPLFMFYASWSGLSHSTYDALRNHLDVSGRREGLGRIHTTVAERLVAAGVAAIAAVEAMDRLIMYFDVDPGPRLRLDDAALPAIRNLFLAAVGERGTEAQTDVIPDW